MTPFTLKGHILFIFHYIVMFFTYLDTPSGGLQKKNKNQKEQTMDKRVIMIQYRYVFGDKCVFPRLQLKLLSHIVWFPIPSIQTI
jgi:hypothetical protein